MMTMIMMTMMMMMTTTTTMLVVVVVVVVVILQVEGRGWSGVESVPSPSTSKFALTLIFLNGKRFIISALPNGADLSRKSFSF